MLNLTFKKNAINPSLLHEDLKAALGDACHGLSFGGEVVTVHLIADATAQQQADAERIVQDHDPAQQSAEQIARQTREALPFFRLDETELAALAEVMDSVAFRREMARAFACLRDLVLPG
jgi:hypothetical protein